MENLGQFNLPKFEQQEFDSLEWMLLEDQLERSLQMPPFDDTNFSTSDLPNDALIELPLPSLAQQNFITENNNIFEADFHLWNTSPSLSEDEWKPISSPFNMDPNSPNPNPNNPNPNNPNPFDQNDPLYLLNNTNLDDYFNDEMLNMINIFAEGININNDFGGSMETTNIDNYMVIKEVNRVIKVPKNETISYEEIKKYFDLPISKAAKELNVGLTVLKKRCREFNIMRWPHRKIKSLQSLISNVKEMGMTEYVEFLEENKRKLYILPGFELTPETKKLRQSCFKAAYKRRRGRVN